MDPKNQKLDIPAGWQAIDLTDIDGTILIIGAPDTGKSTLVRYLYQRLGQMGFPAALLDGDPGQSVLGPPSTMTLVYDPEAGGGFPPDGSVWRRFIGSVTPSGHMLPLLVGAARLLAVAHEIGARTILYDTSGLIDPTQGGLALKYAKIDLLQPSAVLALQARDELEPLLYPVQRSGRTKIIRLSPSSAVIRRSPEQRRAYRAQQFYDYFKGSQPMVVNWPKYAVFPAPRFALQRLVALENDRGFAIGLGIVSNIDRDSRLVELLTPLRSTAGLRSLHIGDLFIDPASYNDRRMD